MKQISTTSAPAAIGPYAQAVAVGPFLYTSGQIPLSPDGTFMQGDIATETKQVLENLDAILKEAGYGRNEVVKTTIFMTNLAHFAEVNEFYAEFFGDHRPARSTVQVAALPRGAQIEIEVMAYHAVNEN
ncbi:MAG: RidA family protein [Alicyclobacillaceae bacterium]|uniref:RidA family protein n=1 Tax=Alicyclobacillus sp. SP_1 TaxID=2942475 RepID=UPI00215775D2|nr:RidA family protein [Alicyclobacillus sp. SP_1]MCY0887837.1 RidA family protein [Alicyclobacillaceae bacterium]